MSPSASTRHRAAACRGSGTDAAPGHRFCPITPSQRRNIDPRLPGVVNDIVVEFGNTLYQDTIDAFVLNGQPVADADLRPVWRNTTQSPVQTWDAPVYEQFFRRVRAVNWTLPPPLALTIGGAVSARARSLADIPSGRSPIADSAKNAFVIEAM
jgi:hypothetical protein